MNLNLLLDKLYHFRDMLVFFWQNPAMLKEQLFNNRSFLVELGIILLMLVILLVALVKPQQKKKEHAIISSGILPKPAPKNTDKNFDHILQTRKREPQGSSTTTTRANKALIKKIEPAPIHDLSEEEELALQEAMALAGKQALAEVIGEPHQTEIFQSSQASEAAKKIFAGPKRSDKSEETLDEASQPKISPAEVIIIYYMAPRSRAFEGEAVFSALQNLGLQFNEQHVFEYQTEAGLQFYVSSAVKPGHFDIYSVDYSIPGLAFVLDLLTVNDPEATFNEMLKCIHEFSQILRGDILDEQRQRLTQSSIYQYTARIKAAVINIGN